MNQRIVVAALLLFAVQWSQAGDSSPSKRFQGEIADSSCALNVHSLTRSHQEMLKNKSMGGSNSSCSQYCVRKLGADYVLVREDKVFRLEGQPDSAWQTFAGQRVTLHGNLDAKSNTIHVEQVERAAEVKP